jgi:hypothetical protein
MASINSNMRTNDLYGPEETVSQLIAVSAAPELATQESSSHLRPVNEKKNQALYYLRKRHREEKDTHDVFIGKLIKAIADDKIIQDNLTREEYDACHENNKGV